MLGVKKKIEIFFFLKKKAKKKRMKLIIFISLFLRIGADISMGMYVNGNISVSFTRFGNCELDGQLDFKESNYFDAIKYLALPHNTTSTRGRFAALFVIYEWPI